MLKYLNNKLIIVDEKETKKNLIIEKLVDKIADNTTLITDKNDFLQKIYDRENIGTTGIGKGIAIPHARCESVRDIAISIAIVKRGIDFNTPDGELAKVIIIVGAPRSKNTEYLELLSSITKAFRNKELRDNVTLAENEEEALVLLAEYFGANN
jgi:fructose-specific phosphotransferase system IIA component